MVVIALTAPICFHAYVYSQQPHRRLCITSRLESFPSYEKFLNEAKEVLGEVDDVTLTKAAFSFYSRASAFEMEKLEQKLTLTNKFKMESLEAYYRQKLSFQSKR